MNKQEETSLSKFLSLVLRHQPETINITLDELGWVSVNELLEKCNLSGKQITWDQLKQVVENNEKQRFKFNEDQSRIRANQGHSIEVDLQLTAVVPPELLYHGTAQKNINSILEKGIIKGDRHHVHLSLDQETAVNVGSRYGKPVVLTIKAGEMHRQGFTFFVSENNVWLTDFVPKEFVEVLI